MFNSKNYMTKSYSDDCFVARAHVGFEVRATMASGFGLLCVRWTGETWGGGCSGGEDRKIKGASFAACLPDLAGTTFQVPVNIVGDRPGKLMLSLLDPRPSSNASGRPAAVGGSQIMKAQVI